MESHIFEQKSIPRTYFQMALPVVFGSVVSIFYNMTDTFFIARTQNASLVAGVSLCAPVFTFLMALGNIFGQGGNSLIARSIGKGELLLSRKISSFCFYAAIAFGLFFGLLMLGFRGPLLLLLGADTETLPYASGYYSILAAGAPLLVLSFIHMNLLRSEGMATQSMIGSVGGSLLNIVLDPILIFTCNLGAAGAALATVAGYLFSDCFYLAVVLKKSRSLSVSPKDFFLPARYVRQVFGIGIAAALTYLMQSLSLILTNQYLLPYGTASIAAMGIAQKVNLTIMLVISGFSFGALPMIGYFYGSENREKLNSLLRFAGSFLCIVTFAFSLIIFCMAPEAIRFFIDEPELWERGSLMLRMQVFSMVFVAIILFITVYFQATGKTAGAIILAVCRQGALFFLSLSVLSWFFGYHGILLAQSASNLLTVALAIFLFFRLRNTDNFGKLPPKDTL
ncbi:MAG: MATE family efflux transporter [Lachnospiraceae bacterium]|nr:MATE family efflux transporter [Lachnospiraceae bacterium]